MQSIAILGRQPAIGLAELESLLSPEKLQPLGTYGALLEVAPQDVPFARLGGSMKLAEVIGSASLNNLKTNIINQIDQLNLAQNIKLNIGLSAYGLKTTVKNMNNLGLEVKKHLKNKGYKVRVVPNREIFLNSAQVLHNQLTTSHGLELILVATLGGVIIGRTTNVQDIESYTRRDRERPYRDMQVGMLPPKLAQTIINLAAGSLNPNGKVILDPFCGTGVILQEALLMGFDVLGSDIEQRLVDYSTKNLLWLRQRYPFITTKSKVIPGDAQKMEWPKPVDSLASETLLGPILGHLPPSNQLNEIISQLNLLHKRFLYNISQQLVSGTRLCFALPAWVVNKGIWHLPLLDQLDELGYNRLAFKHAASGDLIYHRPNQIVARELTVLIRK